MNVTCLSKERCIIGEGPIWNARQRLLYHVNPPEKEIRTIDLATHDMHCIQLPLKASAIAFDRKDEMLLSTPDGVFRMTKSGELSPLHDTEAHPIRYANDMKVGPDGRLYVGTQSSKRLGLSDAVDGKLYSIDAYGEVKLLLDGLLLSNGLDWSMDGTRFYHTDSDTRLIREYHFNRLEGSISPTGRMVTVPGVDGFTMDRRDRIIAACWGKGHLAVIDTSSMEIVDFLPVPASIPASCCFAGNAMDELVIVTAAYQQELTADPSAGFTFLMKREIGGKEPYLFDHA